jgi:hypothetical protein
MTSASDSTTGKEVECGPYAFMLGHGVDNLNRCLDDYQRQGSLTPTLHIPYEREPT